MKYRKNRIINFQSYEIERNFNLKRMKEGKFRVRRLEKIEDSMYQAIGTYSSKGIEYHATVIFLIQKCSYQAGRIIQAEWVEYTFVEKFVVKNKVA